MRPQQNRRMRGRGNGGNNNSGRKGPNPLTRSYESNGPDVKIRGSAQQIAEKYATLARDAQASGDRVIAESYLQHAEHYSRIIASAQAQLQVPVQRDYRDEFDDDDEQETVAATPAPAANEKKDDGSGPQHVISGVPAEVVLNEQMAAPEGNSEESPETPAEPPK